MDETQKEVPQVGTSRATLIVDKAKETEFNTVDDVTEIKGIGDKTVDNIEDNASEIVAAVKGPRASVIDELASKSITQSGKGEANPAPRSQRTQPDLAGDPSQDIASTELSEAEDASVAPRLGDEMLPFLVGWKANIVGQDLDWIKTARDDLHMPLKAGISGTTFRFMHMATLFNVDTQSTRLAALGHSLPINAHSFHEVMSAAASVEPYTPGQYIPLKPWGNKPIKGWADKLAANQELTGDQIVNKWDGPKSEETL